MITVRPNTFETNSSSTHSLCIVAADQYDKFTNGEMLYDLCAEKLITLEEAHNRLKSDDSQKCAELTLDDFTFLVSHYNDARKYIDPHRASKVDPAVVEEFKSRTFLTNELIESITDWLAWEDLFTYKRLSDDQELEFFSTHKTINDVEVVAFGRFGWN